jgi:hypothetical protein
VVHAVAAARPDGQAQGFDRGECLRERPQHGFGVRVVEVEAADTGKTQTLPRGTGRVPRLQSHAVQPGQLPQTRQRGVLGTLGDGNDLQEREPAQH